ncbi:hypothetical protein [Moorena sp. SIO3H5]|uniref:hypothetical protein n=1 Tax=Moorena sp. SIO3H5 TaxID=2607834 RepID=UPI0013B86183|nr:hypothetical protein [Moorena sp. SIO3H5]NEO72054.1 hypothetical protein [Moorena sp. SIO3H5]
MSTIPYSLFPVPYSLFPVLMQSLMGETPKTALHRFVYQPYLYISTINTIAFVFEM